MANLGIVGGTSREEAVAAFDALRQLVVDTYELAAQFPLAGAKLQTAKKVKPLEEDIKVKRKELLAKNDWFTLWGDFTDAASQYEAALVQLGDDIRGEVAATGEQPLITPPKREKKDNGGGGGEEGSIPTWVWWAVGGAALLGGILWWSNRQNEQRVIVLPPGR